MHQKVVIYAPYGCAMGHHETDVEIAISELAKGNDVRIIQCKRDLTLCDPNPQHQWLTCLRCHSTSTESFLRAGIKAEHLIRLHIENRIPLDSFPYFNSIHELKDYVWNTLPIGYGVACSAICLERNTKPNMESYQPFIRKTLATWIETFCAITAILKEEKPDLFYVFNGRIGTVNAAYWAAKQLKIPLFTVDRESFDEYMLFENTINTDLPYIKSKMASLAEQMKQDPQGREVATAWFQKNRRGVEEIIGAYLKGQNKGELPEGFDHSKRNIAIFLTSEDELYIAPGWQNPIYKNQSDAIRTIVAAITDPSFHFYLRVHPNLKALDNAQTREIATLKSPNLSVIPANQPVDTYALLEATEKTITFGSTMGIEAVFWNKPSILIGRSFSEDLDACYRPKSHQEVVDLILNKTTPKPLENSLPFGYWMSKRGVAFKHVKASRNGASEQSGIGGIALKPSPLTRFVLGVNNRLHKLKQLFQIHGINRG